MPQVVAGPTIEPDVSVPTPKATQPPPVAEPGPADDPPDGCDVFHGFFVVPRNQLAPWANCPLESLAINTAPALRSRTTTSASSSMTRFSKSAAPHVVGVPFTAKRSFTPQGMPCKGPRYFPALISASAAAASARPCSSMIVTAQKSVGFNFLRRSR